MNDNERYQRARRRVKELKEFYTHLGSYVMVIGFLAVIDIATGDGFWFYWPAFGWGIAVVIHAANTFSPGFFGSDWEERKIRELMEKDGGERKRKNESYYEEES